MILSTKGTNKGYKTLGIVSGVLICCVGIFFMVLYAFFSARSSASELTAFLLGGLLFIGDGIISITLRIISASSYVDIYADHVAGKGIQGISVLDFNIKSEQIVNVTVEKININLHTSSGVYKVISDEKTAKQVFEYFNSRK